MADGIWTAVSGAAAQAQAVDTVANNLANADTLGFKKDQASFKEYLSAHERPKDYVDVPLGPIKDKDLYPLDGKDQSFVTVDGTHTDFKQGHFKITEAPLDVAVNGPGFFEVSTPAGIRFTRHGSFKMATDGRLVTSQGYPVLSQTDVQAAALPATAVQPGQGGLPTQGGVAVGPEQEAAIAQRYINLGDVRGRVSITPEGDLYAGGQLVARLSVVEFRDPSKLQKSGGLLFESKDPVNLERQAARSVVHQGRLETSNVNPVEEMTNLIKANRMFEHNLKAVKTYSEMMERHSEIGKL